MAVCSPVSGGTRLLLAAHRFYKQGMPTWKDYVSFAVFDSKNGIKTIYIYIFHYGHKEVLDLCLRDLDGTSFNYGWLLLIKPSDRRVSLCSSSLTWLSIYVHILEHSNWLNCLWRINRTKWVKVDSKQVRAKPSGAASQIHHISYNLAFWPISSFLVTNEGWPGWAIKAIRVLSFPRCWAYLCVRILSADWARLQMASS